MDTSENRVDREDRGGRAQPLAKLQRFLQPKPRARAGERCEFCTQPLPDEHSHVVNVETRSLVCACRPCYFLFMNRGAAGGKYRSVPDRYVRAPDLAFTAAQWEALQIPVGIAFFFYNSTMGRTVVFYPSPAGATESLLPLETWDEVVQANPLLETLTPDVEALLVYRRRDGSECYIVPIDACYELVGRMRRHWRGFDGGEEAWTEIDAFFARARERSGGSATSAQSAQSAP